MLFGLILSIESSAGEAIDKKSLTSPTSEEVEFNKLNELDAKFIELNKADQQKAQALWAEGKKREAEALQTQIEKRRAGIEQRYRDFSKRYPKNAAAYNLLGSICYDRAKPHEARDVWLQGLAIAPDDANLHNNIGTYYSHYGRPLRAMEEFQTAIKLKANKAVYHFNLGTMYYTSRYVAGKEFGWDLPRTFAESQAGFRRARELEPRNYQYAYNYALNFFGAKYFSVSNVYDEMLDAWRYCLNLDLDAGQKACVLTNMARTELLRGNKIEARGYLTEAMKLAPSPTIENLLRQCR